MAAMQILILVAIFGVAIGQIVGGLSELKPADTETQALVDTIKSDTETQTGMTFEKFEAISYKTQVTLGVTYFVKVQVGATSYIHLKIWKQLDGTTTLEDVDKDKSKEDEIEYF